MSENSNEATGFSIVMFRLVSKMDMVTGEGGCDWRDHLLDDPYCCKGSASPTEWVASLILLNTEILECGISQQSTAMIPISSTTYDCRLHTMGTLWYDNGEALPPVTFHQT